jgi:SAM-dependent methyltransferase
MTTLDDEPKAAAESGDEFAERMMVTIADASLAILISIGHQTGLLDTLAESPPATSSQIAEAAGLNERYVREWLGGLVTGRIIDYHPQTRTYFLPRHRAAVLTRVAGPDNLAALTQYVPIFGEVEQKIIGCFRHGGGLPYSEFPRFHAIMAEQSGAVFDAALIKTIVPLVDGLPATLREGCHVADFGCGSGHAVNVMAQAFPASRFTGYDFSAQAIATGSSEAARLGTTNASFVCRDLAELDDTESYDLITVFDAIHDQARPARVLANIHRALRPAGVFLMVDIKASSRLEDNIEIPWAPLLYMVSTMHCMTVSLAASGAGLGTVWGEQLATSMLADAGFDDVQIKHVESDQLNSYYVARK